MRDQLPTNPRYNEYAIVNQDSNSGSGTHWVAYKKHNNTVLYFDSYGNLKPPWELIEYFKNCNILYNRDQIQYNGYNCGHLCLKFLKKNQIF